MIEEWSDKFNPFNSDKLFAQIYKWKQIKRGAPIPPPTTVSVDPANVCDLRCSFCNANYIMGKNNKLISGESLEKLASSLSKWGVESVCVGGGGESLMNKKTGRFIDDCIDRKVDVGVVTNGTMIDKNIEALSRCNWVGVSVDAGKRETYIAMKRKDKFDRVVANVTALNKYCRKNNTELYNRIGTGIKFLAHPLNIKEIYLASEIAKEAGCSNIHIRPVAPPFDRLGDSAYNFTRSHIRAFNRGIKKARKLEDDYFRVFGVTHKFGDGFKVVHPFNKCYAIFMNCVIMPPSGKGNFDVGFCCDRRGADDLTIRGLESIDDLKDFWGSKKHWEMHDKIKLSECPRCTFAPHNRIYENADKLSYQFI